MKKFFFLITAFIFQAHAATIVRKHFITDVLGKDARGWLTEDVLRKNIIGTQAIL